MDNEKKKTLAEFSRRALQKLKDKKIAKYQTLHIPSLDMDIKVRSLDYGEVMECSTLEDNGDMYRIEKYSIYLGTVEPSLPALAREVMAQDAPGGTGAEAAAGHREYLRHRRDPRDLQGYPRPVRRDERQGDYC